MKKRHYSLVLSLFISLLVSISQVGHAMESEKVAAFDDKKTIDLMGAAIDKYLENTNKLLAQYAPNGIAHKDADGLTPLMKAVNAGDRKIFDAICMVGDSLHLHDNQGRTAYYYATEKLDGCAHGGHEHCCPFVFMKERLEGGINEVDPSNDMTPLMTAAQAGNESMVLWLLANGADFKKVGNYNKTKTAYNVAKNESIKRLLKVKGADRFEAEHAALQIKKRAEIKLRLLHNQQKKESDQAQKKSDRVAQMIKLGLEDSGWLVKNCLFGAMLSVYQDTIKNDIDPLVRECKKDLLQRSLIRFLLDYKIKKRSPEYAQHLLGDATADMLVQAGTFLGEKRLASMGFKKKKPLNFIDLAELVYAQDKEKSIDSEKIDTAIDMLLFVSFWRKSRHMMVGANNNVQLIPEQMQAIFHVNDEIYKEALKDYPRAIQAVATAQDSFGNTPLHYAVLFEDFEWAKELMLAQAELSKQNIKKITSLELILKMGNSDKLKDLLAIKCNDITHQLRKAVPTELEIRDLVAKAPPAAGAGAGRHDVMRKDMKKDFDHVQENLKKDILSAALAKVPVSSSNTVVAAQPDAEKLAQAQKAQELAAAQLAKEQEAQKIAKMAAKQAAKKERRRVAKDEAEQALIQAQRDAEKKQLADNELALRNAQERAQKRKIEVQNKLEQTQSQAQASKLELEKQLQESKAQRIYFKHIAHPDIYVDDQAPTHYAQWLHEHRLAEGAYCEVCNNAKSIKARVYREDAVQEQLQRRETAMDWKHREQALLARKEQKRLKKLEVAKKKQVLQAQLAERVKQIEQRLSSQNKQA